MTDWEKRAIKAALMGVDYCENEPPKTPPDPKKHAAAQQCIREIRKARGLTLTEVAELTGCSKTTIHCWETGVYRANWDRLCSVLPELEQFRPKVVTTL